MWHITHAARRAAALLGLLCWMGVAAAQTSSSSGGAIGGGGTIPYNSTLGYLVTNKTIPDWYWRAQITPAHLGSIMLVCFADPTRNRYDVRSRRLVNILAWMRGQPLQPEAMLPCSLASAACFGDLRACPAP